MTLNPQPAPEPPKEVDLWAAATPPKADLWAAATPPKGEPELPSWARASSEQDLWASQPQQPPMRGGFPQQHRGEEQPRAKKPKQGAAGGKVGCYPHDALYCVLVIDFSLVYLFDSGRDY